MTRLVDDGLSGRALQFLLFTLHFSPFLFSRPLLVSMTAEVDGSRSLHFRYHRVEDFFAVKEVCQYTGAIMMTRPCSTVSEQWAPVQRRKRPLEVLFSRNDPSGFVTYNDPIIAPTLKMFKKESARRAEAEQFYDNGFVNERDDSGFISALSNKAVR